MKQRVHGARDGLVALLVRKFVAASLVNIVAVADCVLCTHDSIVASRPSTSSSEGNLLRRAKKKAQSLTKTAAVTSAMDSEGLVGGTLLRLHY